MAKVTMIHNCPTCMKKLDRRVMKLVQGYMAAFPKAKPEQAIRAAYMVMRGMRNSISYK